MSSAEALADLADRGELDIHGGKSGKNRTKQEAAENKHMDVGGHTRKIVEGCANGERNHKNSNSDKS